MNIEAIRHDAEFVGSWPREGCYWPVSWYYRDGCLTIDSGSIRSGAPKAELTEILPRVRHIYVHQGLGHLKQQPFSIFPNLESIVLSDEIQRLNWYDFAECKSLKKVTLPEGIPWIPSYTFSNCTALEEVNIPDSVTTFGDCAFFHCESLKHLHIPAGLEEIGRYALSCCAAFEEGLLSFDHCPKLKSIPRPGLNLPEDDGEECEDDYWFFGDAWRDMTEDET